MERFAPGQVCKKVGAFGRGSHFGQVISKTVISRSVTGSLITDLLITGSLITAKKARQPCGRRACCYTEM